MQVWQVILLKVCLRKRNIYIYLDKYKRLLKSTATSALTRHDELVKLELLHLVQDLIVSHASPALSRKDNTIKTMLIRKISLHAVGRNASAEIDGPS